MNVNLSNELIFSDVHEGMNHSGSLAKFTFIHFARDPHPKFTWPLRDSFDLHATHCGSYLNGPPKNLNSFRK